MDSFCGSAFWNSSMTWHTGGDAIPDFTVCFQYTVLAWIPCVYLWLVTPVEVYYLLSSRRPPIPWNWLNLIKMVTSFFCLVVCLVEFVFAGVQTFAYNVALPNAYFYTPFIKACTLFLAIVFMLSEKRKGFRSSGVMFLFWLLAFLCGLITYRSLLLRNIGGYYISDGPLILKQTSWLDVVFTCYMIYYPLVTVNLILNCFSESRSVGGGKAAKKDKHECPEKSASFPSRMLFSWFTPLVIKGFKRPLELKHLWALNNQDRSINVARLFDKNWRKEIIKAGLQADTPMAAVFSRSTGSITIGSTCSKDTKGLTQVTFSKAKRYDQTTEYPIPNVVKALARTYWPMFVLGASMKFLHDAMQFVQPQLLKLMIEFIEHSSEEQWKGFVYAALMFMAATVQSIALSVYFHRMYIVGMRMRTALISAIYRKSLVLSNAAKKTSTSGEIVNLMSNDAQKFMDLMVFLNMIWSAPLQICMATYFLWHVLGPAVLAGLGVMVLMIPLNAWLASMQKKLQTEQMKFKDNRIRAMNEMLSGMKVLKLYAWETSFESMINKIRYSEVDKLKRMAYLGAGTSFLWSCAPFLVSLVSFLTYVLLDEKNVLDPTKAFVSLTLFQILRFPLSMLPMLISMLVQASVSVKRMNKFLSAEELDDYVVRSDVSDSIIALSIDGGSFAWSKPERKSPILKDINMRVLRGKLVAVVGQVGCGKSSLISALLGDMEKVSGDVEVHGKVAYVAQQTWIQNATLQENILFNSPFDSIKYNRIIDACALRTDLEILPGGDKTEIGEKGINLSGGQKQRVSLARACYSDADVFLLDDPLSAVDSHVGKHIFDEVIGNSGYLAGRTRILITHGISFLPFVDQIVVLDDGCIREQGTYKDLLAKKGAFAEMLMQFISEETEVPDDLNEDEVKLFEGIVNAVQCVPEMLAGRDSLDADSEDVSDTGSVGRLARIRAFSMRYSTDHLNSITKLDSSDRSRSTSISRKQSVFREGSAKSILMRRVSQESKVASEGQKLTHAETTETGRVKWSIYFVYFSSVGYTWMSVIAFFNIISHIFALSSNVWLSAWSNDIPLPDGSQDTAKRDQRLAVYGILGFSQGFSIMIASFALAIGSLNGATSLHTRLLRSILRSPMSFFDITPLGRIVNRFSKDIDTMDLVIPHTIRAWIMCFLQCYVVTYRWLRLL